jgi:hypothetical protein
MSNKSYYITTPIFSTPASVARAKTLSKSLLNSLSCKWACESINKTIPPRYAEKHRLEMEDGEN